MKQILEIQNKLSEKNEAREKLRNGILETDDVKDEARAELIKYGKEIQDLETKLQCALQIKAEKDEKEKRENPNDLVDSEQREKDVLLSKASLIDFIEELRTGKIEGASRECRQAFLGEKSSNLVPIELFAPRAEIERRADTETTIPTGGDSLIQNSSFLNSVFPQSILNALGIPMIPVPVGNAQFIAITTGPTAGTPAQGAEQDAPAVVFEPFALEPQRAASRVQYARESAYSMEGLEEALKTEIRAAISNQIDKHVISGASTGFVNELPNPTNPGTAISYQNFVDTYTGLIDGVYASDLSQLRILLGAKSYEVAVTKFRTTSSEVSSTDFINSRTAGLTVSGHIPAPASNIQRSVVAKLATAGTHNSVVSAWSGVELIEDRFSNSAKSLINITGTLYFAHKILRESAFALVEHKVA